MSKTRVKSSFSLKAQLANYSLGACAQLQRPENATGIRNWVRYSAAAASALAAVASADAGVIYSGVRNIVSGPNFEGSGGPNFVNIDGDGAYELLINGFETGGGNYGIGRATGYANGFQFVAATTNASHVNKFSLSQYVGSGNAFASGAVLLGIRFRGDKNGQFQNSSTNGLAGFRFNMTDGVHYGWIRLLLEDTYLANGLTDKVTAIEWAYESRPDTPIHVGDRGAAVPEPSSLTIVGLAMGCSALPALRRRRQFRKAAASQANG